VSAELVAFRASAYERPLWALPNRVAGRWNAAGDPPVQYLALHPMGPWAEVLRHLGRRGAEAARSVRVPTWALRVTLTEPPQPITFASAPQAGLRPEDLVADDHRPCREAAARLRAEGVGAIVTPSAALPGTEVLVLFGARVVAAYDRAPIDPGLDIPAALLQQDGRCPEGLWEAVHHRGGGRRHPALRAFRSGVPYRFTQPPVTAAGLRT
jgi:RES domain-containing protein